MSARRKTKVVCTIGPAVVAKEKLFALADAGMDVARLNFSHGEHAWHAQVVDMVKEYNALGRGHTVSLMLDTKGPEVRSGDLKAPINLAAGDSIIFTTELGHRGDDRLVTVSYADFIHDVAVGDTLLVDGGLMSFRVTEISGQRVTCRALESGELASRRHLNVRGKSASLPSITDKDWEDIAFGVEHGIDFFALSFVKNGDVVRELKTYLQERGAHAKILAKIESADSVRNLADILEAADGAMVARGDLGAELPVEEVPMLQEEIVRQCREQGKPVIVATNMLESMITNPVPTRAEVSDIAIAVREGADAVMLSGETAYGQHPFKALQVMCTVASRTERAMADVASMGKDPLAGLAGVLAPSCGTSGVTDTSTLMALHAASMASAMNTPLVVFTRTGAMAGLLAQQRPARPVFAFTNNDIVLRRLSLYYGVVPVKMEFSDSSEETFGRAMAMLKQHKFMEPGQLMVLLQSGKKSIWRNAEEHLVKVQPLH